MSTVDIGSETYDVFADQDFADAFLAGDVMRATGWALRNVDARGRGLVSATRMLLGLPWNDAAPSFDAPPEVVREVTAMLAADLLAKPRLFADASGDSNVKTVKGGPAQVEFFRPVVGGPPIPAALWRMLQRANLVSEPARASENDGPFVGGLDDGCRPLGGRLAWDYPIAALDHD